MANKVLKFVSHHTFDFELVFELGLTMTLIGLSLLVLSACLFQIERSENGN